ncbi:MAG: carbonic anhydrase [Terracidiphilus sp.]|jgi:carbonic anhydrase
MSSIPGEAVTANKKYSALFEGDSNLALPRARPYAVLTCMDARLDPIKNAGLADGEAHIIRNAGGRASDDAIRTLIICYKLLGAREFIVMHHTCCAMEYFTNEEMRGLLANSLEPAQLTADGFRDSGIGDGSLVPGSRAGEFIEWLPIADREQAVIDDVLRIRSHPLIPPSIAIHGCIYDLTVGKLIEVEAATKAGAIS